MNKLDFYMMNTVSEYLKNDDKVNFFRINKFMLNEFFMIHRIILRQYTISRNNLCIICEKFCGCEGHLIYLCKCVGLYPVQHITCSELKVIPKYSKISNCPLCLDKTMVFFKKATDINMI